MIGTAGGRGLGAPLELLTSSLRAFVHGTAGVPRTPMDLTLERDDGSLPPQFVLGLIAFAIVLSAIVTLVLVTSLQNG